MFPPQLFSAGNDSGLPLQGSVSDLACDAGDPLALRLEHGDLVFELYERESGQAAIPQLGKDLFELDGMRVERPHALVEMSGGSGGLEVMHEKESGDELRVLTHGL